MSMLNDLGDAAKSILSVVAPAAATVLGGPLAGLATQKIITALGLPPGADALAIGTAVAGATPEQLIELKKIDASLLIDLKKLDVDIMQLEAADTASARQREVATSDYTPRVLAGLVFLIYIGVTYFVFAGYDLHDSMRDIALRSLGTLDAAVGLVLGYYFGSSLGSSNKDRQISALNEKKS